jgi:hypothetical protein
MNTTTANPYPNVRVPAGADFVDEWEKAGTPDAYRLFDGSERVIARSDATVGIGGREMPLYIRGTQNPDGTADRFIVPPDIHPDCPITVKQAFELGLALVELAFEAREMAKLDLQQSVVSDPEGTIA